jgi:DNA polymerase III epsilon subunit-like protein
MKLVGKIGTKEGLQRMFRHLSSSKGGRKLCFVGHNIQNFDLRILYEEAKRHGLDKELKGVRFVDTLAVAQDKDVWQNHEKERPKSFSLENLYSYLVGGVIPFQHSAVGDVLANAKVLESLDPDLTITRSKYVREFRFE